MKNSNLRSSLFSMAAYNFLSIATIGLSYIFFSRGLSVANFGLYATALFIARIGAAILDGGIRNSIIKSQTELAAEVLGSAYRILIWVSFALMALALISLAILSIFFAYSTSDAFFLLAYFAAYIVTYPFFGISQALLERSHKFKDIAFIEAISMLIEYAAPIILWIFLSQDITIFAVAAWAGKLAKCYLIALANKDNYYKKIESNDPLKTGLILVKEGLWLQFSVLSASIRDSLHIIVIGAMYGKEWVGFYSWALQICAVSSQIFIQTVMRVVLPTMGKLSSKNRYSQMLVQTKWLAISTMPIVFFLPIVSTILNNTFFQSKWNNSIVIVAFLVARMLPSIGTTTLGTMLLVEKGAKKAAIASLYWSLIELIFCGVFVLIFKQMGLAYSYSITAWIGLYIYSAFLMRPRTFGDVTRRIVLRPSLIATIMAVVLIKIIDGRYLFIANTNAELLFVPAIIIGSYLMEREVRAKLLVFFKRSSET